MGLKPNTGADGQIEVDFLQVRVTKLHNVRSDLSDVIEEAGRGGRGKFVASMRPVLDEHLDTIPVYSNARIGYANNKAIDRAIDEGTGTFRGGRDSALSPQELHVKFDAFSDAEKEAFRKGVRRDIAGLMGTSKNYAAAA